MDDDKQKDNNKRVRWFPFRLDKQNSPFNSRIFRVNSERREKRDLERISQHISYKEATKSKTAIREGIDNTPNDVQLKAMRAVAENVFEPLRLFYGIAIGVGSFFRCKKLNYAVSGSSNSQHMRGEAIDIDADTYGGLTNADIFYYIKDNLIFDQMIWEFGDDSEPNWVHVSFTNRRTNRGKITIAYKNSKNKTKYKNWDRD